MRRSLSVVTFTFMLSYSFAAYSQLRCASVLSVTKSNSDALDTGFINLFTQTDQDQRAYDEAHKTVLYKPRKSIFELTGLNEQALSYFKNLNPEEGVEEVTTLVNDLMAEDQDAMKALKHITKGSYNIQAQNKSYDRHKPLLAKIMTLSSEELSSSPGLVLLAFFRIFNKFNLLPHHTFVRKFEKALLYKLDTEVSGKVRKQMLMEFSHLRWRSPLRHSPYFLREYRSYILENFKDFDLSLKLQVLQAETVADNPFLPSQLSELFEHVSSDLGYDDRYHAVSLDQLNGMYRAVLFLSAKNRNNSLLAPLKRLKENLIESALKNFSSDITKSETDESESKKRVRHYQRSEKRMLKEFKKISRGEVSIEFISSDLGVYDPVDFFIHNQKLVVEVDGSQHFFRFIDLEGNHIQNSSEPMRNIDRARGFIFRQNGIQLIRHNPMKESFNSLMSRVRSKIR